MLVLSPALPLTASGVVHRARARTARSGYRAYVDSERLAPSRAIAWFRVGDESAPVAVGHGGIVGRLPSAALWLDDGRVSEAHAMVSLRGTSLRLMGLRGRFSVNGAVVGEVALRPGLRVGLAEGVDVVCVQVDVPSHVLGLAIGSADASPIVPTGTTSLVGGSPIRVRAGVHRDAAVVIWSSGMGWRARIGAADPVDVAAGTHFDVGGAPVHVVDVPVENAATPATATTLRPQLTLVVAPAGVSVAVEGAPPVFVGGTGGRLLGALAAADGPLAWREVAARVWVDDRSSEASLRQRFDTTLSRLRARLRGLGVPALVRLDRAGSARLDLHRRDVVRLVEPEAG